MTLGTPPARFALSRLPILLDWKWPMTDLNGQGAGKTTLVQCPLGVASAHLRTGTLWWYQMRGRQAKFFRNYRAFR